MEDAASIILLYKLFIFCSFFVHYPGFADVINSGAPSLMTYNTTACNQPCREGTFESQPCQGRQPKVCQACTKRCPEGQYISSPCNSKRDIQCSVCSPKCFRGYYEYTSCQGNQDRQCREIQSLPQMTVSQNVLSENRQRVSRAVSYVLHQDPNTGPLTHSNTLDRKSGIVVNVHLRESQLAPVFRAVNHARSHDNAAFRGDPAITQHYCPYPVPEKYELAVKRHTGITTQAVFYNCTERQLMGAQCESATGYYLDPRQPCETYTRFGRVPDLEEQGGSILCTRPGLLTELFGVTAEVEDQKTMFYVDKDIKCAEKRTNCDQCLLHCAEAMKNQRGMHPCNVTADESDNGESPRLQYCYSCCNRQDCSNTCDVYHDPACPRERCLTGNVAVFTLTPHWPYNMNMFGCHIEPVPDYKIYDIEFYAYLQQSDNSKPRPINNRKLTATRVFNGTHPENAVDTHNFLQVHHGSKVRGSPTMLTGDTSSNQYSAGYYTAASGASLADTLVRTSQLYVRPKEPLAVNTQEWNDASCDTDQLSKLVSVDTLNPGPLGDAYRPDLDLLVRYVDRGKYQIFNRNEGQDPLIHYEIPPDVSVLEALYDKSTVRDDSTLKMEIVRDRRWNLKVTGQLVNCPGYFNIKVRDQAEPADELFHYDVGVDCPKSFSLMFQVPTEGPDNAEKRYQVEITDSYRTIKATVVRPVSVMTQETKDFFWKNETQNSPVNYNKGEVEMREVTPTVLAIGGALALLLFLLVIGFLTDKGKTEAVVDPASDKVLPRHLFFVVCHVTFSTAYSVAVTFTVLALLMQYVNREPLATLSEFSRYLETGENLQTREIAQIQEVVMRELHRQNSVANETKLACEQKLVVLQRDMEQMKSELPIQQEGQELISHVALEYTRRMLVNLTRELNEFKQEFSEYARRSVTKLSLDIAATAAMLESNKWLQGAKTLRDAVAGKRSQMGLSTKPLLEWMGLKQQIDTLDADLSLRNFPMPDLSEFTQLNLPSINTSPLPIPRLQDITLPRNQWYFHQPEPEAPTTMKSGTVNNSESSNTQSSNIQPGSGLLTWRNVLISLLVLDVMWFIHRMASSYASAKLMLYGVPTFVHCRQTGGATETQSRSCCARLFRYIKETNLRLMRTDFVPKLVVSVTAGCLLYFILGVSSKLLTVKTAASVGYIESLVAPVETSYQLAKTRIKTNAYRINRFEFPFYEELVNMRTKRYQLLLNMYADLQQSSSALYDAELCSWRRLLDPEVTCNCTGPRAPKQLEFPGCELPPVVPQPFERQDFGLYREQQAQGLVPYLNAARQVVTSTCHLAAIFVLTLLLIDTLCAVLWLYAKRLKLLRVKQLLEVEHLPRPKRARTQ